jgi:hypothetical protein
MSSQSASSSLLSRRFTVVTVYGGYLCLALVTPIRENHHV